MEPVFKIDASDAYSEGQEMWVVMDGTFGMYIVKFKSKGLVPSELNGSYSHAKDAKLAVEQYLNALSDSKEIKERRKAVKVGKEKWAAKNLKAV